MIMKQSERRSLILELVRTQELATQAEVAAALRELGHDVVQTTVSRDIAELGLVKVRARSGRLVYAQHGQAGHHQVAQLRAALTRWMRGCAPSGNLLVMTTPPGFASALAQEIDEAGHPMVLATIAGDNTVLVIAPDGSSGADVLAALAPHLPTQTTTTGQEQRS